MHAGPWKLAGRGDQWQDPLLSPSLSSLQLSEPEVAHVFHLPLTLLADPNRLRESKFRGGDSYIAVDVSDLIGEGVEWAGTDPEGRDEFGGGAGGKLEIWGLTGWYLGILMKRLGVWR